MDSSTGSIFNGASRYANDFQAVIDRAVAIQSLSLTALQQGRVRLSDEQAALQSLQGVFASLEAQLSTLDTAMGANSLTSSVSNGAILKATVTAGALPATYQLEVTDLGSYTSMISKDGLPAVTDPAAENLATGPSFTLTVDGQDHEITPTANTLNALAEAINDAGLEVEAAIVNLGGSGPADYRLALQSTKLGPQTIALSDAGTPLLDTIATGAVARYKVNGLATEITTETRAVTLAPNVTIELLGQSDPGQSVTVTVSRNTSAAPTALASFAAAYNAAQAEIDKHRGEDAGALAGQSVLTTLAGVLRQVSSYTAPEGVGSLEQLGLSFNDQGQLVFDATEFETAVGDQPDALADFLGGLETGGFLNNAREALQSLTGSTDGLFESTLDVFAAQLEAQDDRIETEQTRIDSFAADLQARISAADALIAALEQQVLYVQGLFSAFFEEKPS